MKALVFVLQSAGIIIVIAWIVVLAMDLMDTSRHG